MKKIIYVLGLLCVWNYTCVRAQNRSEEVNIRTLHFPEIRNLVNSDIPGAPILSQPQRIDGTEREIRTEKHGLIYPAFFDWNGDGKKDLLLGEFETGQKGSYIKVFLNEGTEKEPRYSGKYFYATDINGDTITNYQWCCIGIHPRIVDLDQDGYLDILSGQYNPGQISWWRGSKDGFLPRVFIEQEGYDEKAVLSDGKGDDPNTLAYWNYTSAHFADYNGDGLLDLFVGGSGGLRVALNVGTKEKPKFGLRQYLLHTDGSRLTIHTSDEKSKAHLFKTYMTPVDWDGDGVLDILLTYEYVREGHNPVEFFKGVQTSEGLRFEKAVPLFTERSGRKALPGCQPMITVVDYNNDGILDIVLGLSIPTLNGFEVAPEIAWKWIRDIGIEMPGKDAGRGVEYAGGIEKLIKKLEEKPTLKNYYLGKLDDYKYLTLRHRGYVFVLYGSENPKRAERLSIDVSSENVTGLVEESAQKSVSVSLKLPDRLEVGKELEAEVIFAFKKGWHGYVDDEINTVLGFIPTTVDFEFPEGVEQVGKMSLPEPSYSGPYPIYEGNCVSFRQKFVCSEELLENGIVVKAKVQYQVCNENMCMPPVEEALQGLVEK
mgnify:CR=1 FL=1